MVLRVLQKHLDLHTQCRNFAVAETRELKRKDANKTLFKCPLYFQREFWIKIQSQIFGQTNKTVAT